MKGTQNAPKLTYQQRLLDQGIPAQQAGLLAQVIAQFESNQGRPNPHTQQLLRQYKLQICHANLWRFRLLSPTSNQRINTRNHVIHEP